MWVCGLQAAPIQTQHSIDVSYWKMITAFLLLYVSTVYVFRLVALVATSIQHPLKLSGTAHFNI